MYVTSRRLSTIATSHPVFEEDQVLSHGELNGMFDYLDMQERLSRVELCGIGIVCGLEVSLSGNVVTLTKGIGVTTDGDLVRVEGTERFEGFFRYREGSTKDGLLEYRKEKLEAYELVRRVEDDPRAQSLADFQTKTAKRLGNMLALLFVERTVTNPELCSAGDCDDVAQVATDRVKLLLVDESMRCQLKEQVPTPDAAARKLLPIAARRVILKKEMNAGGIALAYKLACDEIRGALDSAFDSISSARGEPGFGIFDDIFPLDPAPKWKSALSAVRVPTLAGGLQYHYDFLVDVVETYEAFRCSLFDEKSVCRPDFLEFPKHLLLGSLNPGKDPATHRTGFYPSCATSAPRGRVSRARFFAKKLDALVSGFAKPEPSLSVVTPSVGLDRPLDERAMPFYCKPALHEVWSYDLARQGLSKHVYSYGAASRYNAEGAAADPLGYRIGQFSFFRVEGHIGKTIDAVLGPLQALIEEKNLPFCVRTVLIESTQHVHVFPPLKKRFTDSRKLHYLIRHTLAEQVEDAAEFANDIPSSVEADLSQEALDNVKNKKGELSRSGKEAGSALRQRFKDYRSKPEEWKRAADASADLRGSLRQVAKTEVATPIDALVGSKWAQWLDWLDEMVKDEDDKAVERVFFEKFLAEHPALEHLGGVHRGGTLVLVYDQARTIVADFCLPYACPEPPEAAVEPEPKPRPILPGDRPSWRRPGVVLTLDKPIASKLEAFQKAQDASLGQERQEVRQLMTLVAAKLPSGGEGAAAPSPIATIKDPVLKGLCEAAEAHAKVAKACEDRLPEPDLTDDERAQLVQAAAEADNAAVEAAGKVAGYLDSQKIPTEKGKDGYNALLSVNGSLSIVKSEGALEKMQTLGGASTGASKRIFTRRKAAIGKNPVK